MEMKNKLLYKILLLLVIINATYSYGQNKNQKGSNYTLVYEFPYSGEVLVNDVLIDKSIYGTLNGTEFINYFILDNGEQTIKTELKANKGTISSESLKKVSTDFGIYNADMNNGELQNIQLIQKLNFPDLKTPVPNVTGQWKFKANLPFKLEGWKNSEDLSKWDKDKLEKEVVKKYNELREILNSGNSGEFVKELAFANKEFFVANYYNESKKNEFLSNLAKDFSKQKGLVPPIENYKLRIMGNGKVVALESSSDNDSQGVLTTKDIENKKIYVTYIMLHKPQNSDKFQIVRYLAYNTSLLNR